MTNSRFEDLGISEDVLRAVRSVGWTEPTPVQTAAIPVGLEGADLLAQAQTGTGKTGTFGSIILSRTESGSSDPTSLVLVPTRELASQVSEELDKLSVYSGHVCIPIYGGVNIENQAKQFKKGVDVVVATPGRLKDLIERRLVNLDSVSIVVLDEADRMLDMGFAPSVNMILSKVPKKRQTMMFSATMPEEVKRLAIKHMVDHREVLVSKDELTLDLTEQYYIMTNRESKRDELTRIIEDEYPKMVVFCRTKRKVDYLTRKLKRDEYNVDGIHGDIGQNKREKIIKQFSDGELQVLIASDVASRGLDFEDVDIVVNYDIPVDPETYVHRIGRTGRAGKTGKAITFVMNDDLKGLKAIEKIVAKKISEIPWTSALYVPGAADEPAEPRKEPAKPVRQKRAPRNEEAQEEAAPRKQRGARKPRNEEQPKEVPTSEEEQPIRKERTLRGKLDKKNRRSDKPKEEPQQKKQRGARKPRNEEQPKEDSKSEESPRRAERKKRTSERTSRSEKVRSGDEPAKTERPESNQPDNGKMQYKPQGVPSHPRPLHSYVGIVRAARPKKDMSFDRLELNIGSDDGIDLDRLKRFVIKTAHVEEKDLGNMHVSEGKSRIQVVRYRSQEVVDELFGQDVNGKRVLIYNLSDKK